jgi:hypothetical protein
MGRELNQNGPGFYPGARHGIEMMLWHPRRQIRLLRTLKASKDFDLIAAIATHRHLSSSAETPAAGSFLHNRSGREIVHE